MVLEYGWAYGKFGLALQDKVIFQTITTGGSQENYCAEGRENHTVLELLEPFKQTSKSVQNGIFTSVCGSRNA